MVRLNELDGDVIMAEVLIITEIVHERKALRKKGKAIGRTRKIIGELIGHLLLFFRRRGM